MNETMLKTGSASRTKGLKWGTLEKLEFIEFRLYWEGRINRGDLIDRFKISVPQASNDLAKYQELEPRNMEYDKSLRCYIAREPFRPIFEQSSEKFLAQLLSVGHGVLPKGSSSLGDQTPSFGMIPAIVRHVEPKRLRQLIRAIRTTSKLEVMYQSFSQPEPKLRWITPHALAHDGRRWHARAFCHVNKDFRDFVIARILDIADEQPDTLDPLKDRDWQETVRVRIGPHPKLQPAQRKAIELDYDMKNGECAVDVRRSFLYYFLTQMNLREEAAELPPEQYQVVALNPSDFSWPDRNG